MLREYFSGGQLVQLTMDKMQQRQNDVFATKNMCAHIWLKFAFASKVRYVKADRMPQLSQQKPAHF